MVRVRMNVVWVAAGLALVLLAACGGKPENTVMGDSKPDPMAVPTPTRITSLVGVPMWTGYNDGPAAEVLFDMPSGIAMDSTGALYISEFRQHTIRKIQPGGATSTFLGFKGWAGAQNGDRSEVFLHSPAGLAIDGQDNLYIADMENHCIRRTRPDGFTGVHAGTPRVSGYADGPASRARFSSPRAVAVDRLGNLYVADTGNHCIRKVGTDGMVSTVAGAPQSGFQNGPAGEARFNQPMGLVVREDGLVLVADAANHAIRVVGVGEVSTLAGGLLQEVKDGSGSEAGFSWPGPMALDAEGSAYVFDLAGSTLRKVTRTGKVTTIAGHQGESGKFLTYVDGPPSVASLWQVTGVVVKGTKIYMVDQEARVVRLAE